MTHTLGLTDVLLFISSHVICLRKSSNKAYVRRTDYPIPKTGNLVGGKNALSEEAMVTGSTDNF